MKKSKIKKKLPPVGKKASVFNDPVSEIVANLELTAKWYWEWTSELNRSPQLV